MSHLLVTYIIHLLVVHVECVDLSCQVVDLSRGLEDGHGSGQLLTLKDIHVTLQEGRREQVVTSGYNLLHHENHSAQIYET